MATQDIQGLVQRCRNQHALERTDFYEIGLLGEAADALERLSAQRGTCNSCRFSKRAINPMTGSAVVSCVNVHVPRGVRGSLLATEAAHWGCIFHEPQPTATEEASKTTRRVVPESGETPGGEVAMPADLQDWTCEEMAGALLNMVWRYFDAAGQSHGRSHVALALELARELLPEVRGRGDVADYPGIEVFRREAFRRRYAELEKDGTQ